jgi:hypothetical protein
MAHFARLNENNVVEQVIVINNFDCVNAEGVEDEAVGAAFCNSLIPGTWVQTSYNGKTRKNFAAIGGVYDATRDAFIHPQPYASWLLNEDTCAWYPPVEMPVQEGFFYTWNEETVGWDEHEIPPYVEPEVVTQEVQVLQTVEAQPLETVEIQALSTVTVSELSTTSIQSLTTTGL